MKKGNLSIPLEDTYQDVLNKARKGLGLSEVELAHSSNLPIERVTSLLAGNVHLHDLGVVARSLGLGERPLLALAREGYHPGEITLPEGMALFTTSWGEMDVHSYLLWDRQSREAVAFDTGADCSEMMRFVKEHDLILRKVLLTHGHGDHVFDLDRLIEKTGASAWIGEGEDVPGASGFAAGKEFHAGSLRIRTRLTWGHAAGGITYVIDGLNLPVAVVGDALFAGSMGGPKISYKACLETNRKEILSLPPETILCPGHGPLTTVALELANNPFFPELEVKAGA